MAKLVRTKSSLFTLSLVAVLLLSVYVATDSFSLNLGTRASRGQVVENGTLVFSTQSSCDLGNYALISSSGQCVSVVASSVDQMVNSRVKVVGILRESVLYAESVTYLSKGLSPTSSSRPIINPTRIPYGQTPDASPHIPPPIY